MTVWIDIWGALHLSLEPSFPLAFFSRELQLFFYAGKREPMQMERRRDPAFGRRVIIHLDLDCFYAQVEQRRLNLSADEPIAVQQWGSLLAVNYVARKFGVLRGLFTLQTLSSCHRFELTERGYPVVCETGEYITDAKKKCPKIHLVCSLGRFGVLLLHGKR